MKGRRLERSELAREAPDGRGGNAGERLRPLRSLHDAVGETEKVGAIGGARGRPLGQVGLVEAQYHPVEEGLIVKTLAHDDLGHGDEHGRVGAGTDGHMLVGELQARPRGARVDGDHADAPLVRPVEVLGIVGAEGAVGGTPSPQDHEARVDVVGGLASRELAVGLGAVGVAKGEDLRFVRETRPELRAAPEEMQEALDHGAVVDHRRASRARAVEDGLRAIGVADASHLPRHLVERLVPRDARVLSRALGADPAHRIAQPVGMIHPLRRAEAAHARGERRQLRCPLPRIRADAHDGPVLDVGVDHATPAAVVGAGAGEDLFARCAGDARRLVDRARGHGRPS